VLYLAAVLIVASVALFVAAPLGGGLLATRRAGRDAAEAERLEHERALAMQGLRELEFDREMGKLSDADYAALHEGLMTRALAASAALERLHARVAAPAPEAAAARPRLVRSGSAAAPAAGSAHATARIRFCPQCGIEVAAGNFCSECGAPLSLSARAAARAER
jgi:cytochrome c-type biogenesis protein CcmI